jgi:hypothetical protein
MGVVPGETVSRTLAASSMGLVVMVSWILISQADWLRSGVKGKEEHGIWDSGSSVSVC